MFLLRVYKALTVFLRGNGFALKSFQVNLAFQNRNNAVLNIHERFLG